MPHPRDVHVSRLRDLAASICARHGAEVAVVAGQRVHAWTDGVFSVFEMRPGARLQAAPRWFSLDVYERGARRLSVHWREGDDATCAFIERSDVWLPRFLDATAGV